MAGKCGERICGRGSLRDGDRGQSIVEGWASVIKEAKVLKLP